MSSILSRSFCGRPCRARPRPWLRSDFRGLHSRRRPPPDAAAIVIPPRANAVEPTNGRPLGQRDRHITAIGRDGRMKWQVSNGYGKRSLVETAVGRYKSIIGRRLRARSLPKSPSVAPSSTACLPAHTRNPSAERQLRHDQRVQKIPVRSIPDPCTNAPASYSRRAEEAGLFIALRSIATSYPVLPK